MATKYFGQANPLGQIIGPELFPDKFKDTNDPAGSSEKTVIETRTRSLYTLILKGLVCRAIEKK